MSKKITIITIILVLILVLGTVLYLEFKPGSKIKPNEGELINPSVTPEEEKLSERYGKFTISGGEIPGSTGEEVSGPTFEKEFIVDPLRPNLGENQKFLIWVKDSKGIKKVTGEITTETGKETVEFRLIEGNNKEGRWFASWTVNDFLVGKYYPIELSALNEDGQEAKISFPLALKK